MKIRRVSGVPAKSQILWGSQSFECIANKRLRASFLSFPLFRPQGLKYLPRIALIRTRREAPAPRSGLKEQRRYIRGICRVPGDVAQLGEHLLCKQGVSGSNPLISTSTLTTE